MPEAYITAVKQTAQLIKNASHLVVFTGAGLSTPSGIPDFRSQTTGLWKKDDPMVVASLTAFKRHPDIFFNWLRPLARAIWNAQPNPAHSGLAELEKQGIIKAILTQNIDDLHQRAGSNHVAELHGSLETFTCPTCSRIYHSRQLKERFLDEEKLPECFHCHSILKPDITLFEEMLPANAWMEAEQQCQVCDLMIVLGSSLSVYPAAHLPAIALENNSRLVLINLTPTPLDSQADVLITHDVSRVVPELVEAVLN
jgi:NAD-dependent deacetylase